MLCLERDAVALPIETTVFAENRARQGVAGVELQTRLGCHELEHPARACVLEPRGWPQFAGDPAQHKVVVVAAADSQLRLRAVPNPGSNHLWRPKI